MSLSLAREFARVLKNTEFVDRHRAAVGFKRGHREDAAKGVAEWEELRDEAASIKKCVREDLMGHVEKFTEAAREKGAFVYFARNGKEANEIVRDIAERHSATEVVKSKSLTTEECGLNPFLARHGVSVVDTDLGERIVQLFGEPPSHITMPAIHRSRKEIGELFAAQGICEEGETDPVRLTEAARRSLRKVFLSADLGITGANFLVAETGSVVVVENEANSLLGTSVPRCHIAVAGIEKLVPKLEDLGVFLTLLARSGTGQRISTYTTHYTGPAERSSEEQALGLGDRELHIVLLDNGRSELPGTPAEDALGCIRCGGCLNVCPVYARVGGHAYGWVYPGPIGTVLAPQMAKHDELPKASTLCGACTEVCPTRIDLAKQIHAWRGELVDGKRASAMLPPGLATLMKNPKYWRLSMGVMRRFGFIAGPILKMSPAIRRYRASGTRRLPPLPKESFRTWYQRRQRILDGDLDGIPAKGAVVAAGAREVVQQDERDAPAAPARVNAPSDQGALHQEFERALIEAGGSLLGCDDLPQGLPATKAAAELLDALGCASKPAPVDKAALNGLEQLVVTGQRAMARSGSIWIDFRELESRLQLLLPEELIVLVPKDAIVFDLKQHYEKLSKEALPDCGTLLAGPSKTADIELTLVMGAHGPKRMRVVFFERGSLGRTGR